MLALAAYPATMRQIPASGLIFDVSLDGPDDGVPVVLLHGFPQDHSCWDPIVADLVAALIVIVLTLAVVGECAGRLRS